MYVIMYSFETHLTRSDLITSLSSAGVFNAARVRQQIRLFDFNTFYKLVFIYHILKTV